VNVTFSSYSGMPFLMPTCPTSRHRVVNMSRGTDVLHLMCSGLRICLLEDHGSMSDTDGHFDYNIGWDWHYNYCENQLTKFRAF